MYPEGQRGYQGTSQHYEQPRASDEPSYMPPGATFDDEFLDSLTRRMAQRMSIGKIQSGMPSSSLPSANMRLALAIVSVSLIAFIAMFTLISFAWAPGFGLSFAVLGVVTVALIVINAIFNRWGQSF
jgi:hypothetical protein